jgi:hypothetical protein
MAQPVRQCTVALNAVLLSEEPVVAIALLSKLLDVSTTYL